MAMKHSGLNKQYVTDLINGSKVSSKFAIRSKEPPREYKNRSGKYFFLELGDSTGNIPAKYWGGPDEELTTRLYNNLSIGDIVEITGNTTYDKYDERLVIIINEEIHHMRKCDESEYNIEDYLPTTKKNVGDMMLEIQTIIDTIKDPHLKKLLDAFFDDAVFVEEFKSKPGTMMHHHNYVGGLLEHTVSVLRLCDTLCDTSENLNRDLLLTAAVLHDVGKIPGYALTASVEQTDEGLFIGHVSLGDRIIHEKIKSIEDFPDKLEMELSHIILSHHGYAEWGIPYKIKTAEACALYFANELDEQVQEMTQAIEEGRSIGEGGDEDWAYIRKIGRPVYLK